MKNNEQKKKRIIHTHTDIKLNSDNNNQEKRPMKQYIEKGNVRKTESMIKITYTKQAYTHSGFYLIV
jgi:hypothetical protein